MASEPSSVFSDHTQSMQSNHDGTEFINNIGQSISDSKTSSQVFEYCDVQKMRFLQSQSHKLNKIIEGANKVQTKLTQFLNRNCKTEKILIEFYEFACQIFKNIGLLKETFDMSLSRISTVYKTVKKNFEKTKNSNKKTKTQTVQPLRTNLLEKAQTFNFPSIPKVLQMKESKQNPQPSIKDFNTQQIPYLSYNAAQNQIQTDFKEIQLQILKRMKKYQNDFQPIQHPQQYFKSQKRYNTIILRASDKEAVQNYQHIKQAKMQRMLLERQIKTPTSKSNNTPNDSNRVQNSSGISSFDVNLSDEHNESILDNLIKKVLNKKYR